MSKLTTHTIVKYKPWLYLPDGGAYQDDEFTTVNDIGYVRNGHVVTVEDYLYWENNYVAFIMELLDKLDISCLEVTESGNYKSEIQSDPGYTIKLLELYESIIDVRLIEKRFRNEILSIEDHSVIPHDLIPDIIRIYSRGLAWSMLSNANKNFTLHISGDSYFYVTTTLPELELMKIAAKYGLYVNPREYIDGYPINVDDYRIV